MITHVQTHISIPTAMYLHERAKAQTLLLSCRNFRIILCHSNVKNSIIPHP